MTVVRNRPHASTAEQVVVDYPQDHDPEALIVEPSARAAAQGNAECSGG